MKPQAWQVAALLLAGLGVWAGGCNNPLHGHDLPNTPYERFQTLRGHDQFEERGGFGRPDEQELRRRLRPLEPD